MSNCRYVLVSSQVRGRIILWTCISPLFQPFFHQGSRVAHRLRELASHQCGPSLNPGVDAICRVSLLLVLSFAPRGFFFRVLGFPLSSKTNIPSSSLTRNQVDEEPLSGCATSKSKSLFIYSFTYSFIYLFISRIIKISCMNCYDVRFWRPSLYQFKQIDKKYLRFQVRFENSPFS